LGVEFTRGTALLALTSITSSVTTLTVTTVATTAAAEGSALALTLTQHASGRNVGLLLLDVGSRDDLGGQVKPLSKVVETLGGQSVVVPLPRELSLDVAAAGQGLQSLDDIEVLDIELGVLREVVVLGGDEHALAEQSLVDGLPVSLRDKHLGGSAMIKMSRLLVLRLAIRFAERFFESCNREGNFQSCGTVCAKISGPISR
jgi:hypothetical protein